jgi:hypothetical protein
MDVSTAYSSILGIAPSAAAPPPNDDERVRSAESIVRLLAAPRAASSSVPSAEKSPFSRAYGMRVVLAWSAKFVTASKMAAKRAHLLPRAWRVFDGVLAASATLSAPETVPNGVGMKVLRSMRAIIEAPSCELAAYGGALGRVLSHLLGGSGDAAASCGVVHIRPAAEAYAKFVAAVAAAPAFFDDDATPREVEAHAAFAARSLRIASALFRRSDNPRRVFEVAVAALFEPLLRLRARFDRGGGLDSASAPRRALLDAVEEALRASLFAPALLPTYREACAVVRTLNAAADGVVAGAGAGVGAGARSTAAVAAARPKKRQRKSVGRAGCDATGVPLSFQRALFEKVESLVRAPRGAWALSAAAPLLFRCFLDGAREARQLEQQQQRVRSGGAKAALAKVAAKAAAAKERSAAKSNAQRERKRDAVEGGAASAKRGRGNDDASAHGPKRAAAQLSDSFCVFVELLALARRAASLEAAARSAAREAAAAMAEAARVYGVYRPEEDEGGAQFNILARLAGEFVGACETPAPDSAGEGAARAETAAALHGGECSFMYRYNSSASCSPFDSLPLTS